METKPLMYISFVFFLILIISIAVWITKRNSSKHNGKQNATSLIIFSAVVCSLVGGSSTVGTVQLATTNGLSAWWFTLGAGLGCLLMALIYLKPLYQTGEQSLPAILRTAYGEKISQLAMCLMLIGNLLTVISQLVSGISFFRSALNLTPFISVLVMGVIMYLFVIGGGVQSLGQIGLIKLVLLLFCTIYSLIIMLYEKNVFLAYKEAAEFKQYITLFSRGVSKDLNSGLSLLLGVITTQTYIQIATSGKTYKQSKRSLILCSIIIPVIGFVYIMIGMYMRQTYPNIPGFGSLIIFISSKFHPIFAGLFFATLLITLVGTSSGIALGMSTMLMEYFKKNKQENVKKNNTQPLILLVITIAAMIIAYFLAGGIILDIGYLAMSIRGAVGFIPLTFVLFNKGKLPSRKDILYSIIISLISMIILKNITDIPLLFAILIGLLPVLKYFNKKESIIN